MLGPPDECALDDVDGRPECDVRRQREEEQHPRCGDDHRADAARVAHEHLAGQSPDDAAARDRVPRDVDALELQMDERRDEQDQAAVEEHLAYAEFEALAQELQQRHDEEDHRRRVGRDAEDGEEDVGQIRADHAAEVSHLFHVRGGVERGILGAV